MIAAGSSVIRRWTWIVLVCSCWPARAVIKEWRPVDGQWQNRNNWDGGRLPCWRSTVVLPEEAVVSVFLNGSVSFSELVMPQTGELVLDWVTFAHDARAPCDVLDVKFKNWQAGSWFDPDRWSAEQALAVPHSERIPCAHDTVHLPDRRALALDFNRIHSITVGQLKYGDKSLTADEWRDRLASDDWRYQVHNPPREAHINGTQCDEPLGCLCGHNVDAMQMVCSNAGTLCSNQLECPDGFRPPGHCCDMCGAMMKLTVDERVFTKSALDRLVSSMLKEEPTIQGYSYRTGGNVIHLNIVDNTTNERSVRIARKVHDYLMKDKKGTNLYGILALEMLKSGLSHSPTHHLSPEELRLIMSNLASTFVTFIILGLAGFAFYYYKRHGFSRPREDATVSFARFQNDSGNVEIAIDSPAIQSTPAESLDHEEQREESSIEQSPYAEAPEIPAAGLPKTPTAWKKLTRAFVNPLFGDPSASRMSGLWTMSSLMKSVATQENPIFDLDVQTQSDASAETMQSVPGTPAAANENDDASSAPTEADECASVEPDVAKEAELPSIAEEMTQSATSKRKLKKLWKKATGKFASTVETTPSDDAPPPPPPPQPTTPPAEEPSDGRFFQLGQRRDDEVCLTEETDEQ